MIHDKYLLVKPHHWDYIYKLQNNIYPEEWYGSVLYLGMGSCYAPSKQSDNVIKTTIVEIDQKTINFNKDNIKPDWVIVCDDAFTFEPTEKYDFIFADIWYNGVEDHQIVDNLVEKYKKYLTENGQVLYLKTIKR